MTYGQKSLHKSVYFLAGVLVVLVAVPLIWGPSGKKPETGSAPGAALNPDAYMSMEKPHHEAMRDGRLEWVLDADSAQFVELGKRGVFDKLQLTLFGSDKTETRVSAVIGEVDFTTSDFVLRRAVRVENQGYALATEAVTYSNEARMLRAPRKVEVTGPSLKLRADSMHYDLDSKKAVFQGKVHAILGEKKHVP